MLLVSLYIPDEPGCARSFGCHCNGWEQHGRICIERDNAGREEQHGSGVVYVRMREARRRRAVSVRCCGVPLAVMMSGKLRCHRFAHRGDQLLPVLASSGAVVAAITIACLATLDPGTLTQHMLVHIALMNVLAPLIAFGTVSLQRTRRVEFLFTAMLVQFSALALLHTPLGFHAAMASVASRIAAMGCLLLVAVWFWECVLRQLPLKRWRSVLALLVTGKLYCLLGVLLLFAPRVIVSHGIAGPAALADQQSAGLLMLIACPLTYIAAAVLLCVRWLDELGISDCATGIGRDPA